MLWLLKVRQEAVRLRWPIVRYLEVLRSGVVRRLLQTSIGHVPKLWSDFLGKHAVLQYPRRSDCFDTVHIYYLLDRLAWILFLK